MAVVLVGLPAVGKSTVGKTLAGRLGVGFTDTDAVIEQRAGMPIPQIFAEQGEAAFRDLEATVAAEALEQGGVVALGGGAVTSEGIRRMLADHFVVWLRVSASMAAHRAGSTTHRPLLAGSRLEKMTELKATRDPLYAEVASMSLSAGRATPAVLAQRIAERIGKDIADTLSERTAEECIAERGEVSK